MFHPNTARSRKGLHASDPSLGAQCTPVSELVVVMYLSLEVSGNVPLMRRGAQNLDHSF